MCFKYTPKDLNNDLNEKRRKAHGTIYKKSIQKDKSIYRNGVNVRDRENVITYHPKENIVKLNKLT